MNPARKWQPAIVQPKGPPGPDEFILSHYDHVDTRVPFIFARVQSQKLQRLDWEGRLDMRSWLQIGATWLAKAVVAAIGITLLWWMA